jgi:hypothetical protein
MKDIMISIMCTSFLGIAVSNQSKIIKMFGLKSSKKFEACEQCAIAKAQQKNVNKNWLGSSNVPGEHLYIDVSSIKERTFGGAKVLGTY